MSAYRITRLADLDLLNIAKYTREQWGDEQRDKYIHELFALLNTIAANPEKSPRADYIRRGLRKQLHPNRHHAVYFRLGPDGVVEVLRVLHVSQDRKRAFE